PLLLMSFSMISFSRWRARAPLGRSGHPGTAAVADGQAHARVGEPSVTREPGAETPQLPGAGSSSAKHAPSPSSFKGAFPRVAEVIALARSPPADGGGDDVRGGD